MGGMQSRQGHHQGLQTEAQVCDSKESEGLKADMSLVS